MRRGEAEDMRGQLGHLCCRRRPGEWGEWVSHDACNGVKLTAVAGSRHPYLKLISHDIVICHHI